METNKREIDKHLLTEFTESVLHRYKSLCEKERITPDFYTLIDFLFQTNNGLNLNTHEIEKTP